MTITYLKGNPQRLYKEQHHRSSCRNLYSLNELLAQKQLDLHMCIYHDKGVCAPSLGQQDILTQNAQHQLYITLSL